MINSITGLNKGEFGDGVPLTVHLHFRSNGRYDNLRRIERLDTEKDHVAIYELTTCYEFPWDVTRALEVALYRTYCVPSISALLQKTGEFTHYYLGTLEK